MKTKQSTKLAFTTYSPYIGTKDIKEALVKHWDELEKAEILRNLFQNKQLSHTEGTET